jgi:hypothetical protein
MIAYVTRNRLLEIGKENLNENLAKVARAEAREPTSATFLSHSSKDDEVMPGVVRILENHGATVYLDKKDPTLSSKTPKEIAQSLRGRISSSKKFVLFASNNVRASTWVPWELGLADGYRKPTNVCLFPAPEKQTETAWLEQEYLGIYDRIIWGNYSGESDQQWLVWNHVANNAVRLRDWIGR